MKDPCVLSSGNAVKKAANTIRITSDELLYDHALKVLYSWRHRYLLPLTNFKSFVTRRLKLKDFKSYIVGSRLKRMQSIIGKIKRFPNMSAATMQDIAGVRVIADNVTEVYAIYTALTSSKSNHKPLLPPKDYIKEPKKDGYRSIHQVFEYVSKTHPEFNGLKIELQIRTQLQHSWATAVETLGVINQASYKTGEGDEKSRQFFKLVSAIFALREETRVDKDLENIPKEEIIKQIKEIDSKLQIISTLSGISATVRQHEASSNDNLYYILELTVGKKSNVLITGFKKEYKEQAESYYKARETDTATDKSKSILMITSDGIKEIRKAYPNYFLNTNLFISTLKEELGCK